MAKKLTDKDKQEAVDLVCEHISLGKSVRAIFRDEELKGKLPDRSAFKAWLKEDEEIQAQYARATYERANSIFEDMFDIADDKEGDPARDRLRLDTRKWALSKMYPKKYGDKLDLTSDGEKMEQPAITIINEGKPLDLSK